MDIEKISFYINHINKAFFNADNYISKINQDILNLEGMSGRKTRHFYNNLLNIGDARYLEIGTWKGSSTCSALFGNSANAFCIDNWSEFGGPKDAFLDNLKRFNLTNCVKYIETDCFSIDVNKLPKFNIYLYDGYHSTTAQRNALTHFYSCLDDIFIFLVDDWNAPEVREGTMNGINELKLKIVYQKEIRLTFDNQHSPIPLAKETWWNGLAVFILIK
jgi:hypothetical protein